MGVERYEPCIEGIDTPALEPAGDGEWVRFDDYCTALAASESQVAALQARCEALEADLRASEREPKGWQRRAEHAEQRYRVARGFLSAAMIRRGIRHHDERHAPYLETVDAAIDALLADVPTVGVG